MNENRTVPDPSAKLTHVRSWVVRDHHGRGWGPFDDVTVARTWAQKRWPAVPELDDLTVDEIAEGASFWEIEPINSVR